MTLGRRAIRLNGHGTGPARAAVGAHRKKPKYRVCWPVSLEREDMKSEGKLRNAYGA